MVFRAILWRAIDIFEGDNERALKNLIPVNVIHNTNEKRSSVETSKVQSSQEIFEDVIW